MASDTSGVRGCGTWCGTHWFQVEWDNRSRDLNIAVKELIPIIIAAVVWGKDWQGCNLRAYCDNAAVVAVVNSRCCKDKNLMQLLRCLFFIEAHFQFKIAATHIPGSHNDLADDLSRNRGASFKSKMRSADTNSSLIPISLLQWLLRPKLDWFSPNCSCSILLFARNSPIHT